MNPPVPVYIQLAFMCPSSLTSLIKVRKASFTDLASEKNLLIPLSNFIIFTPSLCSRSSIVIDSSS